MPDQQAWPFNSPPNEAVITTVAVIQNKAPILYVCRDEQDGGWQFLGGGPVAIADAMVVSLAHIATNIDPTVADLHDLPEGWAAERDGRGAAWRRYKRPPKSPKADL